MAKFSPTDQTTGANKSGNGLGPRTVVVSLAKSNMTQAELDAALLALAQGGTYSGVTNDAFTIAGVSASSDAGATWGAFVGGTSDIVAIALQGTGTINADSSNALGVTGVALTIDAVFDGSRD